MRNLCSKIISRTLLACLRFKHLLKYSYGYKNRYFNNIGIFISLE